ncbi:hypothetical protein DSM106972_056970 [Dulcicalothrix desertica PCC 7102]|uniref:Uncharacterized protein n=1 Tax=Dulcicalothrix desertica PCC 7102 TaxID=232991 RepID=A0A3S1C9C3_9CYAN|nr:hypothetical protein DSM106972_056970 [Dulcicalothrix desertica PCC 7102]TWH38989.1 hypothetical protein CAL7102_08192 [Dulcicalothrix desertica PCC 7102]
MPIPQDIPQDIKFNAKEKRGSAIYLVWKCQILDYYCCIAGNILLDIGIRGFTLGIAAFSTDV